MKQKQCPRCRETKPTSEYYACESTPDGLDWVCKECGKEKSRIRWRKQKFGHAPRKKYPELLGLEGEAFMEKLCELNAAEAEREEDALNYTDYEGSF